jgi:ABC-type Na+ transport system ATPase subunit NatA
MPRQRHRVLHRTNFESPYVNMPMRLTVRQNLDVFGMLYGCEDVPGRIRALADEFDTHSFLILFAGGVVGFLLFLRSARREGTLLQGSD